MEWGIFNDDSSDYTAEEAVEADFYSQEEAESALKERYSDEDELHVHAIKESEDDSEVEDDEDDD